MSERSVSGKLVLIAGAGSASGAALARALADAGARVIAVGRAECDLTDEDEVLRLASRIHDSEGPVDGVANLVGGWRGGGGLAGQSEEDYRFLEGSLTALRHVSRAFYDDLVGSQAGRLAVVSSTAVTRPLAGGANYAAVKAATEAWARAVAQGFAKDARARDSARDDVPSKLKAASIIFRVKSLAGLEDELAARFVGLWDQPAAEINDTIIEIGPQ